MVKGLTSKQFIERANIIHNNKYDYSLTIYWNNKEKVCIICPEHGKFYQAPNMHIGRKQGCSSCNGGIRKTIEEFIENAKKIHGDKYDYSKVEYINALTKVCIICQHHGEFMQRPSDHIHQKQNCPKCSNAGYSQISIKFLKVLAMYLNADIQHAENKGEYIIEDSEFKCFYKVDGYFEKDNKKYVVEFHGNYRHGNPKIYNPESLCKLRSMRFDEIYKKTMDRMNRIKTLGYEVIYIWERDYLNYLNDTFAFLEHYYITL